MHTENKESMEFSICFNISKKGKGSKILKFVVGKMWRIVTLFKEGSGRAVL